MFGLFEAMSAIEMMDPKMDAGMVCNRDRKVLNFEQSVEEGKLKIKNLTSEEKIGIIDDTFSCLVTWLEGHSLAQTVFTNLYLHKPLAIEDKCLRSFSLIILKLVEIIRDFVYRGNVFEEEDFQPAFLYPFAMPCTITDSKACGMIRDVEEEMQKKVKSYQRTLNSLNKSRPEELMKTSDNNNKFSCDLAEQKEHQLNLALFARLKFSRLFYQSLIILKKETTAKINVANSTSGHWVEDADKCLQQCSETISIWQQTLSMGIKPEPSSAPTSEYRADYPTIMGFEPLINQRFLPPTFPRYTKMKSRKEAIEYMEHLVSRIRHVCKIFDHIPFQMALDFFTEFSKSSSPPSCVLSRSLLQVLYLPNGIAPLSDLIREDVRNFIKPPSLYQKPSILTNHPEAREVVDIFFERCTRPMSYLLQINGHNRARQRDKLALVLEELATIQEEADKLDSYLNTLSLKMDIPSSHLGYFSAWVLYHILRVMIQYLLSGFELELYSTHEYPYIFWYLYEFLYSWMASTLYRAKSFIAEQDAISELRNKSVNKKVKSKKRKQKPHEREWTLNSAFQQLCGGYYKTVSAFRLEGKLKTPWSSASKEQLRYEHRFMPFLVIAAPPPVPYSQYREAVERDKCGDVKETIAELYATACKCFHRAKETFESSGFCFKIDL
uniref:Protein MAK10 homolog n=1 Tax=Tetranychus urticae TaxID=32264 RepID=T1JZA6_TETUR